MTRFEGKDNFISIMEQILCDIKRGKSEIVSYDAMPCLDNENFCGPALIKYSFKIRDKKFDFLEAYDNKQTKLIEDRINDYLRVDIEDCSISAHVKIDYEAGLMRIGYDLFELGLAKSRTLQALNIDPCVSYCMTAMGNYHYINVTLLKLAMGVLK